MVDETGLVGEGVIILQGPTQKRRLRRTRHEGEGRWLLNVQKKKKGVTVPINIFDQSYTYGGKKGVVILFKMETTMC